MRPEFLNHGKQKFKTKDGCKKGNHDWLISKWFIKGTHQNATEFYCRYCLLTVDAAEKEYQSKAVLKEQVNLPAEEAIN